MKMRRRKRIGDNEIRNMRLLKKKKKKKGKVTFCASTEALKQSQKACTELAGAVFGKLNFI
jgi:hypothetical protein